MHLTTSIDIRAAPETVFGFIETPERARLWQTSVSHTEVLTRTPGRVGTTFRETVSENGRGTELRGRITAYRPHERMAFELDGQFNHVEVEFRVEAKDGGTRVTQDADVRFKSALRLLAPLLKRQLAAQSRRELEQLKRLCERGH